MLKAEVVSLKREYDSLGANTCREMKREIPSVSEVRTSSVVLIEPAVDEKLVSEILRDEITEDIIFDSPEAIKGMSRIDIFTKRGVMDPLAETISSYLKKCGVKTASVRTARRFYFSFSKETRMESVIRFMKNRYFNPLIEETGEVSVSAGSSSKKFKLKSIPLDGDLSEISDRMTLSLNQREMEIIKDYFDRTKKRMPTDIELETIAQTWSEHCVHKTMKSPYSYKGKKIKNLFKETIVKATEEINHPDAVSVFHDNAGIFRFDEYTNVCFKVETHNHPSALEPYGGAGTGAGGVIRDIIGTGLSAKPIANTDVFCVGIDGDECEGTIPPAEVLQGIVAGVRDYGNRMGIPTVNGAVHYHKNYIGNPLVFAGSVGIMPARNSFKRVQDGDCIVVIGGKTGRDGIHGATFSSVSLTNESQEISSGAVQIGNPIEEKKMLDAIMEADGLFNAITDCGAGGLSSAVGEMGEETGAEVYLDRVPLKYDGLTYDEIWISESQERMVLSVKEENYGELKRIVEKHNTNIANIGYFRGKDLRIFYCGAKVLDMEMSFLHKGVPLETKKAKPYANAAERMKRMKLPLSEAVKRVMAHPDVKSKEWIVRQYDHEVQSQTLVKPLGGDSQAGANDSSVISPVNGTEKCLVIGCGINPRYGELNPKKMTLAVIDEAVRNVLSQGGDLKKTFILDNFSWGNTRKEKTLGGLVESCLACRDYSVKLGTPFISGKDSLNNFFMMKGNEIEIPPTLLISAISVTEKSRIRSSYFSPDDSFIYAVGPEPKAELLGSVLFDSYSLKTGLMPSVDIEESFKIHSLMDALNKTDLVASCHDVSDGGMIASLFEMCLGNRVGCSISVNTKLTGTEYLFSETQSRYLVQVRKERRKEFEGLCGKSAVKIGETMKSSESISIRINGEKLKLEISELEKVYR